MKIYPLIMAGGSGKRFWPASRKALPKHLVPILGEKSLLYQTVARVRRIAEEEDVFVFTNKAQLGRVKEDLSEFGKVNVIAEPAQRDTAPCIGLGALSVLAREKDPVMAVLPSDHVIFPEEKFLGSLLAAADFAGSESALVTFGISPSYPATGYGYIKAGDRIKGPESRAIRKVEAFKEKPDEKTAEEWIREGGYFWNSGIFVWRASVIMDEIREYIPELYEVLESIGLSLERGLVEEAIEREFPRAPRISIDYGVMEKTSKAYMVEAPFHWNDLGSWEALFDHSPRDQNGIAKILHGKGTHMDMGSRNILVYSRDDHVVATIGLEGIAVVHTRDATLICPLKMSQHVKEMVEKLEAAGLEDVL